MRWDFFCAIRGEDVCREIRSDMSCTEGKTVDIKDAQLSSYAYTLPVEQIAYYPAKERGLSRLLVLDRETGTITVSEFASLLRFFPTPVLFVVNNARVVPARILGRRSTGARIELTLLTPLPLLVPKEYGTKVVCEASVLLRGARRCKVGEELLFDGVSATILSKGEYGMHTVRLSWDPSQSLAEIVEAHGKIPLPPYIKRETEDIDAIRYQSVFANEQKNGSVASSTASLHCSADFLRAVQMHGSDIAEITLYVGYGTFAPIRTQNIYAHHMHEEYLEISENNAKKIVEAKKTGIPIVAIGTTVVRTLESVVQRYGRICATSMMTDIYITPGYTFQCVDHMITNFHMPESSLLVLVSAFASREQILTAYQKAQDENFRFFSYGDAMLIL